MSSDPGSCSCCCPCCSTPWRRSVKRKMEAVEVNEVVHPVRSPLVDVLARVDVENECSVLRETLSNQLVVIQDLYGELEEERNASTTAANETMSMILRLQREKAEIQMEARQFKRFAEEKMLHDLHEIEMLEDAVYKREQTIQALSCEVQAYKERLRSYEEHNYPPLKCNDSPDDLEKYVSMDIPDVPASSNDGMGSGSGSGSQVDVLEKGVVMGSSPTQPGHYRRFSAESSGSCLFREIVQENGDSGKKHEEIPLIADRASDVGGDDMSDRVYTIDAVHVPPMAPPSTNGISYNEDVSTPRGSAAMGDLGSQEVDIKCLYLRLQALEADRESLKQAVISMRTENAQNAQLVLLREIAQNLSKGLVQPAPQRNFSRKPSLLGGFSFFSMFKWIASVGFWRKRTTRSKYMYDISNNIGLLLLLENSPRRHQWRCITAPRH